MSQLSTSAPKLAADVQGFIALMRAEFARIETLLQGGGANAIDSVRGSIKNIEKHADGIHAAAGAALPTAPVVGGPVVIPPIVTPIIPAQTIQPPAPAASLSLFGAKPLVPPQTIPAA